MSSCKDLTPSALTMLAPVFRLGLADSFSAESDFETSAAAAVIPKACLRCHQTDSVDTDVSCMPFCLHILVGDSFPRGELS